MEPLVVSFCVLQYITNGQHCQYEVDLSVN